MAVHASLIKIFGLGKPFKLQLKNIVLNLVLPGAGLIIALWLAISAGWQAALFGGILLLIGIVVYLILRKIEQRKVKADN
jgi:hypothetical protein